MSHRTGVRLVAALLPATALLLPAGAHAERVVTEDVAGDVMSGTTDPFLLSGGASLVPAPDDVATDVTSTSVDHGTRRVVVTASIRDLRNAFVTSGYMKVRTPRATWTVLAERRGRQTAVALLGRRSEEPCRGLRAAVDPVADTFAVTVPTACLDDPRWVQVSFAVARGDVRHDPESGDEVVGFVDDAYSVGLADDSDPAFGPRVLRG